MTPAERQSLNQYTEASATGDGKKWEGHLADDVAATGGPEPMALLRATNETLVLTSTRGNFSIPRPAVTKLGRGKFYPWLFSAVRIHHTLPGVPDLQFKPLNCRPRDVLTELNSLGYPVP